jgi:hypothetical protein
LTSQEVVVFVSIGVETAQDRSTIEHAVVKNEDLTFDWEKFGGADRAK